MSNSHTKFFKKEKIYYLAIIWLSIFMLGAAPVFATNSISIEFGVIDNDNQSIPILYNSTSDITGFQFFMLGIDVTNVYGGLAEENNFYLHQGSTCRRDDECKDFVTGFSMSESPIPSGTGILFYIDNAEIGDEFFDENISVGNLTCLDIAEGFILWTQGNNFDVELGDCILSPIDYNGDCFGDATVDNCGNCDDDSSNDCVQDCEDILGGTSYVDMRDTCDDDPSNDCLIDCAGVWGGDAVYDNCGTCDYNPSSDCVQDCEGNWGGTSVDLGCGCDEPRPSGCDNTCGSTLELDDCGVCGGNGIAGSGDVNGDSLLDINDIVQMVNHVIDDSYSFDSCELIVGDMNSDSVVNILDIIVVIETIIYGDLARTDEILKAAPSTLELLQRSNSLGYITDKLGLIGFELVLSHEHDFSIVLNEDSFIGGYNTSGNETKIIIVVEGASKLFTTAGKFEIEEMVIGTTNGVLLDVAITIIPDEHTLERAYPDPFNPVTTLSFTIPTQSEVALSIYNIQGRKVFMLIDANMDAGYHSIVWDANSYASGVYFVKMVAGEFVSSQKLMFIK